MKDTKNIIIVIIIVALIALITITVAIFLIKGNRESKEVSNNNIVQNNDVVQNNTDSNTQYQNSYMPNLNDILTGDNNNNIAAEPIASTTYYYNQLNNAAKIIYDEIKAKENELKTGTYILDFGNQFNTLLHTQKGNDELNDAFEDALDAFIYDRPDFFYIDTSKLRLITQYKNVGGINTYYTTIEPREEGNYLKEQFPNKEAIEKAQGYVKYMVDQIVEQTKQDSIYQKIRRIHDWMINYIEYDEQSTSKNSSNLYGALIEKKANSEGYSKTFKYLLEKAGVCCVLVTGTAPTATGQSANHMWTYVQLNSLWYAVDITFDDVSLPNGGEQTEESITKYFLKGSTTLKETHKENNRFSSNSGTQFKFPIISEQDY